MSVYVSKRKIIYQLLVFVYNYVAKQLVVAGQDKNLQNQIKPLKSP